MSKSLECPVFGDNNPLTGDIIWKHRVNGGSEAIKQKLIDDYNWDGYSTVATVACTLDDDGLITAWQLHIFGKSKGCKLDASTFFTEQEVGNSVRIQEMDLDTLVFRGSMVSEWVHPDKFHWEYRLPHENDAKKYYRVKEADMGQHMAKPLWLRSSCQVGPGPKLQVFLGAAPVDSRITEIPGSSEKQFPLIFLEKFSIPFLPFEEAGMKLGMGPIPFLIDTREDLEASEVSVNCPDGQHIKAGMVKFLQTAIKPNQRNEYKTWSKEVSAGNWTARMPNYTWPPTKPLEGNAALNEDDEEEDDAGQPY